MRPLGYRILRNISQPLTLVDWWNYQRSRRVSQDTIFVSLPSAGTHWLRTMLAYALISHYEIDETITDIRQDSLIPTFLNKEHRFKYNQILEIPRIQHTHSPYYWIFRKKKVLFLVRDLRNTLVSHYRIAVKKLNIRKDFGAFIRGESIDTARHHDLISRINFLNSWLRRRQQTSSFMMLRYEDLQSEALNLLPEVLSFVGFKDINVDLPQIILDSASTDRMRKLENVKGESAPRKVSGEPSKYIEYFSDSDKQFFQENVRENLIDWMGYDYEKW